MSTPFETLRSEAREVLDDTVALRRRIHACPELGLELPETRRSVEEALAGLDLEVETGGATSAVVATVRGDRPGPTVLLRADMDALPLAEETGLAFASVHEGRMHACGHDAHVAMLASAAQILARRRKSLAGCVKLLFQPGEEGHGGARILVEEGLLEREPRVEAAFAIHVDPMRPAGQVASRVGPLLAAGDMFSIDLVGRGGHASMPHQAVDPLPVASEIVLALQSLVTRRIDAFDPVVISVTRIQAGTTFNVIPATCGIQGTIRSVSQDSRTRAHEGMRRVVEGVASAHGLEGRVHIFEGYPITRNDGPFVGFMRGVTNELLGSDAWHEMPAPIMGAEDFSYILDRVPGAMVFLGVQPSSGPAAPLHSNHMQLEEAVLDTGTALHAAVALSFLERGAALPG